MARGDDYASELAEAERQLGAAQQQLAADRGLMGRAEAVEGPKRAQAIGIVKAAIASDAARSNRRATIDALTRCRDERLQIDRDQQALAGSSHAVLRTALDEIDGWGKAGEEARREPPDQERRGARVGMTQNILKTKAAKRARLQRLDDAHR